MTNDNRGLFLKLKELLDYFDALCEKHNLTYMLIGGSLLGAVRHKGFIPWDDDLDLAMPREDYDKLLSLPSSEFEQPFFLQTPITDKGYNKRFAKLRNSQTTEIPYKDAMFNYNHGIFIDIFPLDAVPKNEELFHKQTKRIVRYNRGLHYVARINGKVGLVGLDIPRKIAYCCYWPLVKVGLINSKQLFRKCNEIASMYNNCEHDEEGLLIFTMRNKRFIYPREALENTVMLEFEGDYYPVPHGYDSILKKQYGDYMTPVKQKSEHGDTIVNVNVPYSEFIKNNIDELQKLYCSTIK